MVVEGRNEQEKNADIIACAASIRGINMVWLGKKFGEDPRFNANTYKELSDQIGLGEGTLGAVFNERYRQDSAQKVRVATKILKWLEVKPSDVPKINLPESLDNSFWQVVLDLEEINVHWLIEEMRKKKEDSGMSPQDVADKTGISNATVVRMLKVSPDKTLSQPTLETIIAVLSWLGIAAENIQYEDPDQTLRKEDAAREILEFRRQITILMRERGFLTFEQQQQLIELMTTQYGWRIRSLINKER